MSTDGFTCLLFCVPDILPHKQQLIRQRASPPRPPPPAPLPSRRCRCPVAMEAISMTFFFRRILPWTLDPRTFYDTFFPNRAPIFCIFPNGIMTIMQNGKIPLNLRFTFGTKNTQVMHLPRNVDRPLGFLNPCNHLHKIKQYMLTWYLPTFLKSKFVPCQGHFMSKSLHV